MKCPNCGEPITKRGPHCSNCGSKLKKKHPLKFLFISAAVFLVAVAVVITAFWFKDAPNNNKPHMAAKEGAVAVKKEDKDAKTKTEKTDKKNDSEQTASNEDEDDSDTYIEGENTASEDTPKVEKQTMQLEQKEDLTDFINSAKATVVTVTTPEMQGSGFLYNANGAIVTNAHVVEGWTEATVKTSDGTSYTGKVIGYSNKTDVAVIHIPELAGKQPFPIDVSSSINIGDEVVALGSPLGKENTATMGYLTGVDRNFVIGTFTYSNLFQISAPTAPGSSGGPLISKSSKKIIAINSAQSTTNTSIGFSIPLNQVSGLISSWISNPMDENQLLAQFYGDDGEYVLNDNLDSEEGYFEDGDVSEDKEHYDYWEYGYQDYWKDEGGKSPDLEEAPAKDKASKSKPEKPATTEQKDNKSQNKESQTPATEQPAQPENNQDSKTQPDSTQDDQSDTQTQEPAA